MPKKSSTTNKSIVFSSLLKEFRERMNMSMTTLSKKLGVSLSLISRCENGERILKYENILELREILQLSISEVNQLLGACQYSILSDEGLKTNHPAIIAIAKYLSRPKLDKKWDGFATLSLERLGKILEGLTRADEFRVSRQWEFSETKSKETGELIEDLFALMNWETLNIRGLAAYHQGHLVDATTFFEQALAILHTNNKSNSPEAEVLTYQHLGDIFRLKGEWNNGDFQYGQAFRVSRDLSVAEKTRQEAIILRKFAENSLFQGKHIEAEVGLEKSLDLLRSAGDHYEEGKTLLAVGWLYDFQGRWMEAIETKKLGMQLCGEDPSDEYNVMKSNLYLGDSYLIGGRYDDAKNSYELALDLSKKLSSPIDRNLIELGLGNTCRAKHEADIAIGHYEESIRLARTIHSPYRVALAQYELGVCLLQENAVSEARSYVVEADKRFGNDTPYFAALTKIALVEYYLALGDLSHAHEEFEKINTEKVQSSLVLSKLNLTKFRLIARQKNIDIALATDTLANAFATAADYTWPLLEEIELIAIDELLRLGQRNSKNLGELCEKLSNLANENDNLAGSCRRLNHHLNLG